METFARAAVLIALAIGCGIPVRAQRATDPEQGSRDATQLFEILQLRQNMAVANIGAWDGEMPVETATRVGLDGHVYLAGISQDLLTRIRAAVAREPLDNVTVLEGAERATNLPDSCCDAVFIRDVYQDFSDPAAMGQSLFAAIKGGGRLAVIDFDPAPGSEAPAGVSANRGAHGIRAPLVVEEMTAAGFTWVRTIMDWPDGGPATIQRRFLVLFEKAGD